MAQYAHRGQADLEVSYCCAYNETRRRFLSSEVEYGDFSPLILDDRLAAMAPGSNLGLWLIPFRSISPTSVRIPFDLIYLDQNNTVIDVNESFPLSPASELRKPAASALVLPANSIAFSGTRPRDRLMLCAPEEMKEHLARLAALPADQNAHSDLPPTSRKGKGNVIQWKDPAPEKDQPFPSGKQQESIAAPMPALQPLPSRVTRVAPADWSPVRRNWLSRLLFGHPPNARKAPRRSIPNLFAYFYTGGVSEAHPILNISRNGMYLLTSERWYPDTVLRMILTDRRNPSFERTLMLNARVVRWGNDGVGFQFVVTPKKGSREDARNSLNGLASGVSVEMIDRFLG